MQEYDVALKLLLRGPGKLQGGETWIAVPGATHVSR